MSLITSKLYLGNAINARDPSFLKDKKIVLVINCTKEVPNFFPEHIKYIKLDFDDSYEQDITTVLPRISDVIISHMNKGYVVFVHCAAGISRSSSMVIYTLMKLYNWSFERTLKYVTKMHPNTRPNDNFVSQLVSLDQTVSEKSEPPLTTLQYDEPLQPQQNVQQPQQNVQQPQSDPTLPFDFTLGDDGNKPEYIKANGRSTYAKIFTEKIM